MNTNIILLGEGCQISWDFDKLDIKKSRSIFEWFLSVKFTDILYIIKKIATRQDLKVDSGDHRQYNNNLYMDNTDIRTTHYTIPDLESALKRRSIRFIDQVESNKTLLFVRYEHPGYSTTENDLVEFDELIKLINPNCKYNLLIFANPGKTQLISGIQNVHHILYNNDINVLDKYITELLL